MSKIDDELKHSIICVICKEIMLVNVDTAIYIVPHVIIPWNM